MSAFAPFLASIPDPEVILKTVAAAFEAVAAWLKFRDRQVARQSAATAYNEAPSSPVYESETRTLVDLVPAAVLATMSRRVNDCWTKYSEVLADDTQYLPRELDNATEAVKRCICRELDRIHRLNGFVPAGILERWWNAYCKVQ